MKEFLHLTTPRKAHSIIRRLPAALRTKSIDLANASGRVLAEDVVSAEAIPPFARSLVDGFAVKARDTYGARETGPAILRYAGEVFIGEETGLKLTAGQCIYVNTGSMVPAGAEAVVMQEYARAHGDEVEITRPVRAGENIIHRGEDVEKGKRILLSRSLITPFHAGVLASLGISRVKVFDKPLVRIISSGNEIVAIDVSTEGGKIRDINRYTLSSVVRLGGAAAEFSGIARDDIDEVKEVLQASLHSDLVLISGGSSKGEHDVIIDAMEGLGGKILFHGLNIKPGKPTALGTIGGVPVFGLPGHPLSCMMVAVHFVMPFLWRLQGLDNYAGKRVAAPLTTNIPSIPGVEEYIGVSLKEGRTGYRASPIFTKSSAISPLSLADGYIVIPAESGGLEKGDTVEVNFIG